MAKINSVWFWRKFMVDKSAAKGGTRPSKNVCANDVVRTTTTATGACEERKYTTKS